MRNPLASALRADLNRTARPWRAAGQVLLWAMGGAVIGCALATGVEYAQSWHRNGSADPRCVLHWYGYVEFHELRARNTDQVTCEYRPDISEPRPTKS